MFAYQVIQLVTAVMYCLLESLAASLNPKNDHWRLRDEAAHILARISRYVLKRELFCYRLFIYKQGLSRNP